MRTREPQDQRTCSEQSKAVSEGKVLMFPTRRVPRTRDHLAEWASGTKNASCTVLVETTGPALPGERAELVAFIRAFADLIEGDAGRALFEGS